MTVITLFEHQSRSYADLGWTMDHPALAQLEQLNIGSVYEGRRSRISHV